MDFATRDAIVIQFEAFCLLDCTSGRPSVLAIHQFVVTIYLVFALITIVLTQNLQ